MATWRCVRCGEEIEESFDACWRCGIDREGEPTEGKAAGRAEVEKADSQAVPETVSKALAAAQIAQLACRILALWMAGQVAFEYLATIFAPFFLLALSSEKNIGSLMVMALIHLGYLVFPIILWKYSDAIGRRIAPDNDEAILSVSLDGEQLTAIAFTVVGVYGVWIGLCSLARNCGTIIFAAQQFNRSVSLSEFSPQWQAEFWGTIAGLAFAIWLVFGSRGIARFVRQIRGDGLPEPETADGSSQEGNVPRES